MTKGESVMQIVTLSNQKGGVAKTTTSYALAAGLHMKGYTVLMIDLDAQSNLSFTAGLNLLDLPGKTLYDVFKGQGETQEAIYPVQTGLDIAVGGLSLSAADMEFTNIGREYLLRKALEPIREKYDFCIIDTSPVLGVLAMNALSASDKVIIPMFADAYSLQGISQLNGFIRNVQEYTNPRLKVDGLLLTRYAERAVLSKALEDGIHQAAEQMETKVYKTRIRNAAAVGVSQLIRSDLFTDAPRATATEDYKAFVDEFLEGGKS